MKFGWKKCENDHDVNDMNDECKRQRSWYRGVIGLPCRQLHW